MNKKSKIIIGVVIGLLVCVVIGLVLYIVLGGKDSSKNDKGENTYINKVKNEFTMSVEEQYDDILAQYFNFNYMYLSDYENLERYPMAYQDIVVCFRGIVKKVLDEEGNHYKVLVSMYNHDEEDDLIVIEGEYKKSRYLEYDDIEVYGIYKGNSKYSIDGKDKVLPKFEALKVVWGDIDSNYIQFDEDAIREVATAFFGQTFTLSKPDYDYTDPKNEYVVSLPFHYLLRLDNNSNARFNNYRIFPEGGVIQVVTEDESDMLRRNISKTSDNKNFILTQYTTNNDYLELQVYNKDFKQQWNRTFKNAKNYRYDNNNGRIALTIDNELYLIDEKTGKDILKPIMVPEIEALDLLANGDVILISKSAKNFILYINNDGSIKWNTTLSTYNGEANNKVDGVSNILVANDKIYVGYYSNRYSSSYVVVFDQNGKETINTAAFPR